jgi:3,4-dihydroxy-9,10-secoandrosta-1,3,5(10)-triene-9,17-dione 4,5-dioxygenase
MAPPDAGATVGGLGYIGLTSNDLAGWRRLACDVLGMAVGTGSDDDTLLLKMDENVYRVAIARGTEEGLSHQGWEVANGPTLEALGERLASLGYAADAASAEQCAERQVGAMLRTADPDGRHVELYVGARKEDVRPFVSPHGTRFVTGDGGLGHLVIWATDHEAALRFYGRGLGLGTTDFLTGHFQGAFLGATARHHSVAIFSVAGVPAHVDHFMVEVDGIAALGQAHDRALAAGDLAMTLGQHWNDRATSFYVTTPSGMDIEYAWGARTVDRSTWVSTLGNGEISFWGHHATSAEHAKKLRAEQWLADFRLVGQETP